MKTVAILGGGISGLSAAYYIRKKFGELVLPVIIERTERCGGWVKTIHKDDLFYETGPRTIRPTGLPGLNTLDLVEEIGIDEKVMYFPKYHPAAQNRFIFSKGKLNRLPTGLKVIFKTTPPFQRPLFWAGLKDIFNIRKRDEDDSVHSFVSRRLGSDIADHAFDPIIRGICAGDAKKISVKFLLPQMYELEQKYGSITLGWLINRILRKEQKDPAALLPYSNEIGFTNLAVTSVKDDWAVWSLEGGLETLVHRLEDKLVNEMEVPIIKDAPVKTIKFPASPTELIEVGYSKDKNSQTIEKLQCHYVVSTIPGWRFSKILRKSKPSHSGLWQLLSLMNPTDIVVTNVLFKDPDLIPKEFEGFGFLVPSNEVNMTAGLDGLLGVVFDTCAFPQGDNTVLTVMSKPTKDMVESENPSIVVAETVQRYLNVTLGIDRKPDDLVISVSTESIPQYVVGHFEKIQAAREFIRVVKMPLILCGASYDGVSINECIYAGRRAAEELPFM